MFQEANGFDIILQIVPNSNYGKSKNKMINLFGSKVGKEELEEIRTSIESQWLGIGKKCALFEERLAKRLGLENFVMLNSGSNSLLLIQKLVEERWIGRRVLGQLDGE